MEKTSVPNKPIEIIARAVILRDQQILLCRAKGADWFFLPGGHVEFGEMLERALTREIKEELGLYARIGARIATVENMYTKKQRRYHEINFLFEAKISDKAKVKSQEDHIEFSWYDIDLLKNVRLLPVSVKADLKRCLKGKENQEKTIFPGRSG